ncbi:MAG TPA: TonB family protein, partial [Phnomibacter sp.]|nr:TonB family protein [Phnomibacter sp.]
QIWDKKGTCMVTYTMKDGRVLKMTMDQAKTKGYPVVAAPPPPPAPPSPVLPATPAAPIPPATGTEKLAFAGVPDGQEPLFIFAGLEITRQQMDQIKPEQIERIEVLKNEQAVTLYGQKGKNGVIAITPKIAPAPARAANEPIVVMGYPTKLTQTPVTEVPTHNLDFNTGSNSPLVYINKTLACMDDLKAIPSNQIRHIQVLKGQQAIEKYGADATNGVLLVAVAADGTEPVFTATEQMPAFPGGRDGWLKYLERNLRYPDAALKNGTQGKVQVEFLVDVYGNISNIKALNNPGDGLAEEAIKLIAKGPKWVPAVQNGLVVNAKVVQDITFRLE